ncbi:phosphatidylglycerophosphatase A [Desulfonispora thiosulfatigenes DSM 11270]|uniref:Phosphatidylglycerophosphatase A n=1 Tax=Desulfonispora thiosulfatigenes DSM 11270 TaxID=656914 RepID=A0A1W1VST6_DESTI|nr:phosphatidylglycerophosphatase A [Desulfonispora thiosulfatigenes]SMB96290.1 phosphatidylglycerophosphatase A [Desulfonispora thiosulfatigenes DSM 11270]
MKKIIYLLATGLGTGNLKPAPGTWGSLLALIITYFLPSNLLSIVITAILGIYICQKAEEYLGEHDSPRIVWDEMVGIWIAAYHVSGVYLIYAFILFRIFDISKIYPIDKLQRLPGGLGIMMDDIVAGIFARIVLSLIMFVI